MRHLIFTIAFLAIHGMVLSQSDYNQQLEKAAISIASKIKAIGKQNIAVLDFENSNKQISELGSWLSGVFTTHLENTSDGAFSVKNNTDVVKAIQQIKTESGSGDFDSKFIQRLGEISSSDVVIYAIITLMDDEVTVNVKAVNPSAGSQTPIGGILVSFFATEGMRTKYQNYIENAASAFAGNSDNIAAPSGVGTDKKSKNADCKQANTGDICFHNNTKVDLIVNARPSGLGNLLSCTLQPGQKQCFYDIQVGAIKYNVFDVQKQYYTPPSFDSKSTQSHAAEGSLYIELCKEITFNIR